VWGDQASDEADSNVLWAAIYLGASLPAGWFGWYQPIYKNLGASTAMTRWISFFVVFGTHTIFISLLALGTPGIAGAGGWMQLIAVFQNGDTWVGLVLLSSAALFSILALSSFFLMKQAHFIWSFGGGPQEVVTKAQGAVVSAAVSNAVSKNFNGVSTDEL